MMGASNEKLKFEFVNFSKSTTLHGVTHITDKDNGIFKRIFWTLYFLLFLGVYCYFLSGTLMSYFNYETTTSLDFKTTNNLSFPSITICNFNMAKRGVVLADKEAHYAFSQLVPYYYNIDLPYPEPADGEKINMSRIYNDAYHDAQTMYMSCSYDGKKCNIDEVQSTTITPNGLCHTFNSRDIIEKFGRKYITRAGKKYGLQVQINLQQNEYYYTSADAAGAKVIIHDPYSVPDVDAHGFAVSPGMETFVDVKLTKVKRLGKPYAKEPFLCHDTGSDGFENHLEYFSHYSRSACTRECRAKYQLKKCGCVDYLLGVPSHDLKVCNFKTWIDCVNKTNADYDINPSIEAECFCYNKCEDTIYDVSVSAAIAPHSFSASQIEKMVPMLTKKFLEENTVILSVYFGELSYTEIIQNPYYDSITLFGELGGQLGLCLGASFFTFAEIFGLLFTLFSHCCVMKRRKTTSVETLKDPEVLKKDVSVWVVNHK